MKDKNEIRQKMLSVRNAMPEPLREEKSTKIMEKLEAMPEFKDARHILFYYTNASEVDTLPLIEKYLGQKNIYLPKMDGGDFYALPIQSLRGLKKGAFGIPEPPFDSQQGTYDEKIELIVVPGVTFAKDGGRIGMGKGFYDRYLSRFPDALAIGLAFDEQILDQVPEESYDESVDFVVTDETTYL